MGLCVASGVLEGGCKNIVGTLSSRQHALDRPEANSIIALRCAVESYRFDDFRDRRPAPCR